MNKTKRRIFNTAMKLFADNGYNATTVEDITNSIGVAKGTLYYHFKSKEEIYNFLVDEGINLLINSVQIKTNNYKSYKDKIKAILLIQSKIIFKYNDLIKILLSDFWGSSQFNKKCKIEVTRYLTTIEQIIKEAIEKKELEDADYIFVSSQIYSLICLGILYVEQNPKCDVLELYKLFEKTLFSNLKFKDEEKDERENP